MDNKMRKIGMMMNILMGFTMSVVLSLVGTLSSRHFTLPGWLMSFGISFVISLIIGFLVPIKKLGDKMCGVCKAEPMSFKGTLISAVISDLIYTPIITIIMVVIMTAHAPAGTVPLLSHILPGSLLTSLIVGYIVIVVIQPLFLKLLLSGNK